MMEMEVEMGTEINISYIYSKAQKLNKVTGQMVPESYTYGDFKIVGVNPYTRQVYMQNLNEHCYINNVHVTEAYSMDEWLFETEDKTVLDFYIEGRIENE